ncbi:hypothetical protein ABZV92_35120 [Streptomyces rubiginosohelvolus]|uniref:hypothetical protein n=1 Tax=Streptomyces rubiginosohelvolus TaxID=67362 RepID=UPI0033A30424
MEASVRTELARVVGFASPADVPQILADRLARQKPKRRTTTVVRCDGREPLGLGSAIGAKMTERGLVAPAAGGSFLSQWETILAAAAPELAGHVQTGRHSQGS